MNSSCTKRITLTRLTIALAICTAQLSACSGSGSEPSTTSVAEVPTTTIPNPVNDPGSGSVAPLQTRVDFNITVPAYVSNSLQVKLTWGSRELTAGWVVDETWSVSAELPSDTENLLNVQFLDQNGDVVLGSYEANLKTVTSPTQTVAILADNFDTASWDVDADGVSNFDESIAGTDPLAAPSPIVETLVRVNFGVTVPAVMSDALQVRLDWGDKEIKASWIGDESWSAFADLPAVTEKPLTVTFSDKNGELPLGSYETTYLTGDSDGEYLQIESRQINTHRFDNDVDGVSNIREVRAKTDPLVSDSSTPVTFESVNDDFAGNRCTGCHSNWRNTADLHGLLLSKVSRNDKKYVVPFKPEESYLVEKLDGSMKKFGGAEMAELVRAWITLGALDN